MIKFSFKKKKLNQTGIPAFSLTSLGTLVPEMLQKMRNRPFHGKTTQAQRIHSDDTSTYVEESFEVMFVPEEEIQQVN